MQYQLIRYKNKIPKHMIENFNISANKLEPL